jgi:hypothetical protein
MTDFSSSLPDRLSYGLARCFGLAINSMNNVHDLNQVHDEIMGEPVVCYELRIIVVFHSVSFQAKRQVKR